MFQRILLLSLLSFFLFACGETKTTEKGATEEFAEYANDNDFRDKH